MGAVTFSLDVKLVEFFVQRLPFDCFIETGTFRGDTLEFVKPYFPQLISIELSEDYYQWAASRFQQDSSVTILKGDSGFVLTDLVQQMEGKSILFWLDAHWCEAENTAGEISQCPLLQELQAIQHLNEHSVLLIDDARLYLCSPGKPHEYSQWPDCNDVLTALYTLSDRHKLMIINDVIVYYPQTLQSDLQRFAHQQGIDWLDMLVKGREHDRLLQEVLEKKQEIHEKEQEIRKLSKISDERLQIIHYLELHPLRLVLKRYLPDRIQSGLRRIRKWFQPKLGHFRQYYPVPLKLSKHYYETSALSQQSLPVVSIITPTLNQAQFLERTITSVIGQSYPNLEYIIQDGASSDETAQILEKYRSQLKHVESCQDKGQAHAINLGFRHARGDIMAWLNSDDLLLPGTVTYIVKFFLDHPELDVVYGHRIVINEDGAEVGRWILPPHDDNVLLWADYIPQETIFWRRRMWEKAGGYLDESYHFALDWELLLRFREAGAKFARLPRFLAAFRVHEHQKTSKELEERGFQEMHRLRERCHGRHVSHEEAHYNIRHYMRKHVFYDYLHRLRILQF